MTLYAIICIIYDMSKSLNIQLTDELRQFIATQVADTGLYSTPSELVRDLIRKYKEKVEADERAYITDMLIAAKEQNEYYACDGNVFDHFREEIARRAAKND